MSKSETDYKTVLLVFLLLLPMGILSLSVSGPLIAHAQPTVQTLTLPSGYLPIGVVYQGGLIWTVSYTYGAISSINLTSGAVTHYYIQGTPDTNYTWQFYGLTLDANGDFWIASSAGRLVEFFPSNGSFVVQMSGLVGFNDVYFYNGFLYFAAGSTLYKYDVATNTSIAFALPSSGAYYGVTNDPAGDIWFTDISNGFVYKFDGTTVSQFTGFHRPLGITSALGYIWVAENVRASDIQANPTWTPAIAEVDSSAGTIITRVPATGSPYGLLTFSFLGNTFIAYSSSGEDAGHTRGIGFVNGTFINIAVPAVYYLNYQAAANMMYFSFYGSDPNGVGGLSDPVSEVLVGSDSNMVDVAANELPTYATSLALTANATTVWTGQSISFTSTLTYSNGTKAGLPVVGKPVSLFINGTNVANGTTDSNGQWSYAYAFTQAGTYTVQSKFAGGTFSPYHSASSSASLTITVVVPPSQSPLEPLMRVIVGLTAFVTVAAVAVWRLLAHFTAKPKHGLKKLR
jgi:hypothetical protein